MPIRQTAGTDDDLGHVLGAVGPRLRELRRQREIALTDLSATTGISVSTLSRLESRASRPSLELLLPLARAPGVTLDELVGARRTGGIQAYKLVIHASSPPKEPDPQTHSRPPQGKTAT